MGIPLETRAHLKGAALLPQLEVHGRHQVGRNVLRHVLRGDHHIGGALLERAEQVGPEIHELALPPGLEPLLFENGGTALAIPEGLSGRAAVAALGQACAERFGAGSPIQLPEARRLQQLADVHGGDAVDTADFRKGQPLGG
jgi:hypothetical protein